MKILQSSFFRALAAMAAGILLVRYPDNTVIGIVITIGVIFLLSGIVSVLSYINSRRHANDYVIYDAQGRIISAQAPMFPIVGIGSMILGAILAITPETFINTLMYIIGAMLILGAIGQYMSIINIRRYKALSFGYWLCPTLILLAGVYILINPISPISMAMSVLGWIMFFYGLVEAVHSILFYSDKRSWEKEQGQIVNASAEEITGDSTNDKAAAINDATAN
jgi:uncharacterized membrane protein HdeD (DUF308 family)